MGTRARDLFGGYDLVLLTSVGLLLTIGLLELYSSSLARPELLPLVVRQLVSASLGVILLMICSRLSYRSYRSWASVLYVVALVLLGLTLVFGYTSRGTTGWIRVGLLSYQPIELVKFIWVVVLSSYLTHVGSPLTWRKTIASLLLLAPLLGLTLAQPDFGSGFVLVVVWGALALAVPKSKKWWLGMAALTVVVVSLGAFMLKDYQRERLMNVVNPRRDPLGTGYNVTQSVIAVGAGEWWGRGLGLGTQSRLKFLPEQHTDFIFASVAEELGFIGGSLVIGLWVVFFLRIASLMKRLRDDFGVLLVLGIAATFAVQVVLNIGMNIGLAPVVGLPLPFMSYGGSSLMASLAAVGILLNLAHAYGRQAKIDLEKA